MRALSLLAATCALALALALALVACGSAPSSTSSDSAIPAATADDSGSGGITGFAFVDSSVTGQGGRAKLPPGTKIYPSGSKITGTDGCPTNRYNTDGMIVAVIDYTGRPTAASVTVTRHPANGGSFENAPYYIDLDAGRTLQFLGPIFDNGTYDVKFSYHYNLGAEKTVNANFALARSCPNH